MLPIHGRRIAVGATLLAFGLHLVLASAGRLPHLGEWLSAAEVCLLWVAMGVSLPRPRVPEAPGLLRAIAVCVPLLLLAARVDHWPPWLIWTLPGWAALGATALWGSSRATVVAALHCLALVLVVVSDDHSFSCPPPGELSLPFYAADARADLGPHVLAAVVALVVAATGAAFGRRASRPERWLCGAVACFGFGLGAAELAAVEAAFQVHPFVEPGWSVAELARLADASLDLTAFGVVGLLVASWLRAHEGSRGALGARNAWRAIAAPFLLVVLVAMVRDPGSDLPRLAVPEGVDLPMAPAPESHWTEAREIRAQVVAVDRAGSSFGWNGLEWIPVHRWHRLVPTSDEAPTLIYADRKAPLDALNAIVEVVASTASVRLVMMGSLYPEVAGDRWAFVRLAEPRPVGVPVSYLPLTDEQLQRCYLGTGLSCSPPFDLEEGLEYLRMMHCPLNRLVFPRPPTDEERRREAAAFGGSGSLWATATEPLSLGAQRVRFWAPSEAVSPSPSPWAAILGALLAFAFAHWRTRRSLAVLHRCRPVTRPGRGRLAPPWLRASEVVAGWARDAAPYRGGGEVLAGPASIAEARASLGRQRKRALRRAILVLGLLLAFASPLVVTVRLLSVCEEPSPAFVDLPASVPGAR